MAHEGSSQTFRTTVDWFELVVVILVAAIMTVAVVWFPRRRSRGYWVAAGRGGDGSMRVSGINVALNMTSLPIVSCGTRTASEECLVWDPCHAERDVTPNRCSRDIPASKAARRSRVGCHSATPRRVAVG